MPPQNYQQPYVYQPQSMKKRIVLILGIFGLLTVLMFIFVLIFSGTSYEDKTEEIVAQQTDLVTVSDLALRENNASSKTLELASTISATSKSNLLLLQQIAGGGGGASEQTLLIYAEPDIEAKYEAAQRENSFNDFYLELITAKLNQTLSSMQSLSAEELSDSEQLVIAQLIEDTNTIIESL